VSGTKGRYVLTTPEGESGLTYSIASPSLVIADHTAVTPALRVRVSAGISSIGYWKMRAPKGSRSSRFAPT